MLQDTLVGPYLWGLIAVAAFIYIVMRWRVQERKVKLLGHYAPILPNRLPFGIETVYTLTCSAKNHTTKEAWCNWFEKMHSRTVEVNLGGKRTILTDDPENIKAVLATQFTDYGKGENFHQTWYEFLGDSIFSTDSDQWHQSRQLLRPQFVKNRVSDLHTFERHVTILMGKLGGDGREVDVKELFFAYALDVATAFLFGKSVDSLDNSETEFAEAFAEVQRIQTVLFRSGSLARFIPRRRFRQHLKVINQFVANFIDDTLRLPPDELDEKNRSDSHYTFLHALAVFTRDRKVLRDQLVAVLLAGRDTTACTLSWAFYELARHPEVVSRLRCEISDTLGFIRAPTYEDLKCMKYLQAILNETLRLYPVVPFNLRAALRDTTLPRGGGPDGSSPVGMPQGTPIAYSVLTMHRRSDLYPPASPTFSPISEFSPERWAHWTPKSWQYLPFNGGPRICIGQQFALTEMAYTIVRVFQRFQLLHEGDHWYKDMPMKSDVILSPAYPINVVLLE